MLEIPETNILIKIVATLFFGCLLVSWYFCMQFDLCIMQSMQNQNKNNKKNKRKCNELQFVLGSNEWGGALNTVQMQ